MKTASWYGLCRFGLLIAIAALVVMGTFAKRGYLDLRRITIKNAELEEKIVAARKQKEKAERQIEAFENRPAAQERLIRQVLGYVRPNETVIEFE